jgi:hypothetical protein
MVRRAYRQRSPVEVPPPDADKLWDATLRKIDALLDDDVLADRVTEPWPDAIRRVSAQAVAFVLPISQIRSRPRR